MNTARSQLISYIEQGDMPIKKIGDALEITKVNPDSKSWKSFIDQLMLWQGGLALAFSAMFFIAYNWDELGRVARFAMAEGIIVLAIFVYYRLPQDSTASKVSLLVATISLGVLLALYGQTYQTGADPWQLFFNWALLMIPWAIIGRYSAIWIVWLMLINTSMVLYHQTFGSVLSVFFRSDTALIWLLFIFNSLAFVLWEILGKRWIWLNDRWAIRMLAIISGMSISWLTIESIFESINFSALVWMLWLGVMYWVYRNLKPDLFMLAGSCLSIIAVLSSFFGWTLLDKGDAGAGGFLLLAFIVIGMGTGAAFWLKKIQQEFQS